MRILFLSLNLIFLFPSLLWASILPTRTILQKTSENTGAGIYAIEQEVKFSNGEDTLEIKETWLIDSDRTMRLTVSGGKDLQNSFKLQYLYTGGQKWSLVGGTRKSEKTPDEFLEKYLNFRNPESFANNLVALKIIPAQAMAKKPLVKVGNDFKRESEPWVRFARTGGVVNYAFGTPSPSEQEAGNPGIWIEQDYFLIRKLRLPTQVEMSASNYNQFSKGLFYPRARTIRWGSNTVTIRLISASPRPQSAISLFQPSSLDSTIKWEGLNEMPAKDVVTEFYTRFR